MEKVREEEFDYDGDIMMYAELLIIFHTEKCIGNWKDFVANSLRQRELIGITYIINLKRFKNFFFFFK